MKKLDRRDFIKTASTAAGAAIIASGVSARAAATAFDASESTVLELAKAMASGETSATELTRHYLNLIGSVDKQINSVIEVNPDAVSIAERLDAERKAGKVRGPLHGIPILFKDNIDTADKMKTTAGSLALLSAPTPAADAFIVARLREAGAVVLGKTNLSEWANFRSTSSVSGWSGRGGQTRNPYILDRNPCGSSSGSAAAVSANLAALAIGTETDGSIVCPASVCGVVGLKPTVGLVSRSGIIPIAHSQDTAGPMTRSVTDAAILLSAMTAVDKRDDSMTSRPGNINIDYQKALDPAALKGKRIGVARNFWGRRPEVDTAMDASLDAMKSAGAELIDIKLETLGKFGSAEFQVLLYEFKHGVEKYLAERKAEHTTLAGLIEFNEDNAAREMPYFKQEIFEQAAKKGDLTSKEYLDALAACRDLTRAKGIDAVMDSNKLDAIVGPSNAPVWMIDLVNGDCSSNYVSSSSIAAVAGYPNITVPAAFAKGLPIGISFFGRAYSEALLLGIAYAFEQTTKARRKPSLLATAA